MQSKADKLTLKTQTTMKLAIIAWIREQLRRRKYYICSECGWEVLKTEAKISGYADDRNYGLHVHCGKCGKIIETFIRFWRGVE